MPIVAIWGTVVISSLCNTELRLDTRTLYSFTVLCGACFACIWLEWPRARVPQAKGQGLGTATHRVGTAMVGGAMATTTGHELSIAGARPS